MCWSVGEVEGWSPPAVIVDLFSQLGPHLRELDEHAMDGCIETVFRAHFFLIYNYLYLWCFPRGSLVKNLPTTARDAGSTPSSGRSPGGGNSNPFQFSCPKNSMDRGAWRAAVRWAA